LWPAETVLLNDSRASRGVQDVKLAPFIASKGVVSWHSIAGADEHIVELFTDAGVPIGAANAQTAPYTIPETSNAAWVRIAARRDGQSLSQSQLMRIRR